MRWLALALALLVAAPAAAVQPDEVLDDPKLEQRAREISEEVRCLVCRNENIDASNAELARDLRLLVRERLKAGDSDQEVKDYLVARYGEFVLLRPTFSAGNLVLWLGGPALLVLGGIASVRYIRRSRPEAQARAAPLSAEEKARLEALMKEEG
ncbi:MAG: cytochrome c-type biogenesis protein [Pseudomonadota bacterium]